MADILNQYWLIIVIAALLVLLAVFFFVPRRDPRAGRIESDAPRAPLEPRKPDIVAAKRNAFADPPSAAPAEPVAPTTAPPTIDPLPASPDLIPATEQSGGDDLSVMKGVGPKLVARLAALGVTRFDQIAAWDEAEIDRIDGQLGNFAGRIRRDDWVEQARLLAKGDRAAFEAKFGALG